MMSKTLAILLCLILSPVVGTAGELEEPVPQRGYSTSVLREPVFEVARVGVESLRFNNWLNSNYEKLGPDQMKRYREHLYYLIDSYIKDFYSRKEKILPEKPDLILEILFSWAERLGVYGGSLVFNAIKRPERPSIELVMKLPEQITLDLEDDLFLISAKEEGWEVKIPYYFMIWIVKDFIATNGVRTQLVSISTGAALDKSEAGHSQASLLLVFSPEANLEEFAEYWSQIMGVDKNSEQIKLGIRNRVGLHVYDDDAKLHKEVTIWGKSNGAFAVMYSGMDGTYQWNRPHFIDFLRSIE